MVGLAKKTLAGISSTFYCFFYLSVLVFSALFTALWKRSKARTRSKPMSKEDKKLTLDLAYYINLAGLDLDRTPVSTKDGFGLDMARITPRAPKESEDGIELRSLVSQVSELTTDQREKPRGSTTTIRKRKYPVLLIPGLMQASAAYCTAGPRAIALTLARAGYDVWLGNNRNGFDVNHVDINFAWGKGNWDWEMMDLALIDVPCMINMVKERTGASHIAVVGHSQGTTQTFLGLSASQGNAELGKSVSSFCALAPAVYSGPAINQWFLRLLRVPSGWYHALMGYRAFLGVMGIGRRYIPLKMFTYIAFIMFRFMLGWEDKLWDRTYRDRNFIFAPVFVSSNLMFWWLGKHGFADRGCIFESEAEPWFDERFPPLAIFTCGQDNLVLPQPLISRLKTHEPYLRHLEIFDLPEYSHLDVLWATDADRRVAVPVAEFIWQQIPDKELWYEPDILAANI